MWAVIIWKIKIESKFQRSNFTTTHIEESRGVRREVHQDVKGCRCRKYLKYWKSELVPILSVYSFFVIPWCPIWTVLFFCSGAQGWSRGQERGSRYSWAYHRLPSTCFNCAFMYNWNASLDVLSQVRAPSPRNGWLFLSKLIGKSSPGTMFCLFVVVFNISENWKGCFLPVSLDDVGHIHRAAGDVCSQGHLNKKWGHQESCALGNSTGFLGRAPLFDWLCWQTWSIFVTCNQNMVSAGR